jgi:undecaprenyl-diphosphatase
LAIKLLIGDKLLKLEAFGLDYSVMTWMHNHRNPVLDHFFHTITWAGSLYVLVPLQIALLGCLIYRGYTEKAWHLLIAFGGVVCIAHILKMVIKRPRPHHFSPLITMPGDASFPSAHTAQITAFIMCLLIVIYPKNSPFYNWLLTFGGLLTIFCVGCSRLYLQVHYLSDVIAGFILASIWVVSVTIGLNRI